jgi:hypothetical protein
MTESTRRVMCIGVLALAGLAALRAVTFRYQEKERAIRNACQGQLQALGVSRDAAKAKYPTPEIHMVSSGCLLPGSTGEVVVKGKFHPDTKFIFENDNVEVVRESMAAGAYHATIRIAPGIGPQTASITGITPATCLSVRSPDAIVIGGRYEWTMNAANGWKIVARSPAGQPCEGKASAGIPYELSFYRNGESAPFEKRQAKLTYSMWDSQNYQFSISQEDPGLNAGMQDFQTMMQKMADPNLSDAQRDALMKRLEQMQTQMQANMQRMTDPAYQKAQEAKRLEFGCERIGLQVQGNSFTGEMRCAEKAGARIALTGTMAPLGR